MLNSSIFQTFLQFFGLFLLIFPVAPTRNFSADDANQHLATCYWAPTSESPQLASTTKLPGDMLICHHLLWAC